MKLAEAIKSAKEKAEKRKFAQSVDIIVTLKNIDLKKAENRFASAIMLPHGKGKKPRVCVVTGNPQKAEGLGVGVFTKEELARADKKVAVQLARDYDFFLAEAPLMVQVGKVLGPTLGPRGKMPKPFPSEANLQGLIASAEKTYNLNVKSPNIQTKIGNETFEDHKIEENALAIIGALEKGLPKGKNQIDNIFIKLTMGPPIKVVK